jgi:hypothetical protein
MRGLLVLASVAVLAAGARAGEDPVLTFTGVKTVVAGGETQCVFTVEIASGSILDLEMRESGIDRMADNAGTDLGTKPKDQAPDYRTQPYYQSSTGSSQRLQVTVGAPKAAAATAREVTLEGALKMRIGRNRKAGEFKGIALAKGTSIDILGNRGVIGEVKNTGTAMEFALEFASPDPKMHIESLALGDGAGGVLATGRTARVKSAEGTEVLRVTFADVKAPRETADINYVFWLVADSVYVPFKLSVPVDGSGGAAKPVTVKLGAGATTEDNGGEGTQVEVVERPKPVGKYGVQVLTEVGVFDEPEVSFTPALSYGRTERYIVALIPAAQPDDYWGYWKMIDSKEEVYRLQAPMHTGSYELRLGYAKYPEKVYKVIERIKVTVK